MADDVADRKLAATYAAYDALSRLDLIEMIQAQRKELHKLNERNQRLEHYRTLVEECEKTIEEQRVTICDLNECSVIGCNDALGAFCPTHWEDFGSK